jgi:hypothetical protein
MILVAREREDLADRQTRRELHGAGRGDPPAGAGQHRRRAAIGRRIDTYYYRIGYGFKP